MRIAIISSAPLPPREGIGFYIWNLALHLKRMGHRVDIITRGAPQATCRADVDGITIWRATFLPLYPFHAHLHGWFVDRLLAKLQSEVDLLHLHSPLVAAPRVRIPTLVTIHTTTGRGAAATRLADLHSLLVKLQAPVSRVVETELFRSASRLTCVSSSGKAELAAYGIDPESAAVTGNGVDLSIFHPDLSKNTWAGGPTFLTVCRLDPRKGLHDLLDCAAIVRKDFPRARFLIAGTGTQAEELRRHAHRAQLMETVQFLGHIGDRAQLRDLYREATALIHPAHYEGLPTVILEAMACGTPVIASGVSGALDVIRHEQNGLLIPARNPARMAAAVENMIRTPGLREALAARAVETVRERYSWQAVTQRYLEAYARLTG